MGCASEYWINDDGPFVKNKKKNLVKNGREIFSFVFI